MIELGKGFDGTIEKAISSTEKLNGIPKILQKFMMFGNKKAGLLTEIDATSFEGNMLGKDIQNYVAQIANLDKNQRKAIESTTKFGDGVKSAADALLNAVDAGEKINSKLFESTLKSWSHGDILAGDINSLMAVGNMKNGDKYALPDTKQAIKNINDWANAVENAEAKQRLLNSGILETDGSTVKLSSGFLKLIQVEKTDAAVTAGLTAEKEILNIVMQAGKQLLVSIAIGAFIKGLELSINTLTAKKLTAATIQTQRAALLANAVTQIQQTNTLAAAQKVLGEAQATIGNATQILTSALYQSAEEGLANNGSFEEMQAVLSAGHQIISNYKMMDKLWAELAKQDPDKIWGKNSTSKSSKTAKASKTALDAWSSLSSAMKEFNQQGYITLQTLKSLSDLEDRYVALLTKNDVTGQLEIQTDAFYNLTKAELKAAQAKGDGVSESEYNKILEWTNRNIKKQTMSYWDLVAAIEGYSAALSGAKDITDTFKDAWSNGKTVKEKQEKSRAGALDYEGTEAQSSALQDLMKYSEYDPELISKAFNKETGKIDLSGDVLKTAVAKSLEQYAAAARTEGGEAAEAIAASYEKSAENIKNDVISVQDFLMVLVLRLKKSVQRLMKCRVRLQISTI